ncbi:hypothetical protein QR680_016023 [Steinernema hermaphroditum]|uniref:Uncharacterized protein n=1 Tax=Steinernema hermaphroditum TaxID=289476 RepID=A0AA39HAT8_9BILA|nr:hypothetical protein QR680_016023 [Steinernema hermaphroditum]
MSTTESTATTESISINNTEFEIFGGIFFSTAFCFGLLDTRILYIMTRSSIYRSRECYRLMIHIGIVQVLMCPGYIAIGLSRLFTFDPWLIPLKLMVSSVRAEIFLSFVLALNRLKIIAGLEYPQIIHNVLTGIGWLVGVAHFVILLTPCCEYHIVRYHYITRFDYSIPGSFVLQRVGSLYMLVVSGFTLLVYILLVGSMAKQRFNLLFNRPFADRFSKEKSILMYAVVRFVCDTTLAVLYHFGAHFLPSDLWVEAVLIYAYQVNNLFIPTALYLVVCGTVRKELIPWRKKQVACALIVQVTTSII